MSSFLFEFSVHERLAPFPRHHSERISDWLASFSLLYLRAFLSSPLISLRIAFAFDPSKGPCGWFLSDPAPLAASSSSSFHLSPVDAADISLGPLRRRRCILHHYVSRSCCMRCVVQRHQRNQKKKKKTMIRFVSKTQTAVFLKLTAGERCAWSHERARAA